jgi:uncharacterized protein YcfJ
MGARLKRIRNVAVAAVFAIGLTLFQGCSETSGTLGGAAIGTGAGAGVGYALGGKGGAVLGGVMGGLAGGAVGNQIATDDEKPQRRDVVEHRNVTVVHYTVENGSDSELGLEERRLELKRRKQLELEKRELELKQKKVELEIERLDLEKKEQRPRR